MSKETQLPTQEKTPAPEIAACPNIPRGKRARVRSLLNDIADLSATVKTCEASLADARAKLRDEFVDLGVEAVREPGLGLVTLKANPPRSSFDQTRCREALVQAKVPLAVVERAFEHGKVSKPPSEPFSIVFTAEKTREEG
jgi:hypothetical protein